MFGDELLKANKALVNGDYQKALKHYFKAEKTAPWDAHIPFGIGNTYFSMGDYDKALTYLNKAVASDPKYANAYNLIG
ncbi:MAG: tetratricopeptide repeat protein, partial [Calditrichaeota bacterium]|nr:tetratricopeptide repeat protein [Calditrichota bacterium]